MPEPFLLTSGLILYDRLWKLLVPVLETNPRLKHGLDGRLTADRLPRSDIWIQAASAGESYIAASILNALPRHQHLKILVTTTTQQGMEILEAAVGNLEPTRKLSVKLHWFPFDMPTLMNRAVEAVHPRVMVLLETELWPGLLSALKTKKIPVLIVNGRMSESSFRFYRRTKALWQHFEPTAVSAVSFRAWDRYRSVFQKTRLSLMPNIKFDLMTRTDDKSTDRLSRLLPQGIAVTMLASVRRPEEQDAAAMIERLLGRFPDQVVTVFPRHMHRINAWKGHLSRLGFPWHLRSKTRGTAKPGTVILWDRFGELKTVYSLASAAFVGGSLRPLGGQNFLEPLTAGVATATGPFLDDFDWVGNSLFDRRMACRAGSWQEACDWLLLQLTRPSLSRKQRKARVWNHISRSQGGSLMAALQIMNHLN